MTSAEAQSRLRIILDEFSQGEWLDSSLYQALDSGQNATIDFLLAKRRFLKTQGVKYDPVSLNVLIGLDINANTTSGTIEYPLSSDYLETAHVDYDTNGNTARRPAAELSFHEARKRVNNSFYNDIENPYFYIRQTSLGLLPAPTTSTTNGYQHWYYKQPAIVTVSQNFTLRPETHDSIICYGAYIALTKDQNPVAADFYQKWLEGIKNL